MTLLWGAPSLATARMKDGTTLIVDLTTGTEKWAFYFGRYDEKLISTIHTISNPDLCFLDVGANIGFYTVSISSLYRMKSGEGFVVAFEPFESNYRRLKENVQRNNLQEYCILKSIGLSDQAKRSEITLREDFARGSETGNAAIPSNDECDKGFKRVPIALETLDTVWTSEEFSSLTIDIIKLDIEGHEDFFLRGAQTLISSQRPTILMEVNKPYYRGRKVDLDPLFLPLLPHDYSLFRCHRNQWTRFASFDECQELDNAMLIPNDKLDHPRYGCFAT